MSVKFFSTNSISKAKTNAPYILFEYLVIAGGGGAGGASGAAAGAGGYRCSVPGENSGGGASAEERLALNSGSYVIQIGAGGAGNPGIALLAGAVGPGIGSNSIFHTITSNGGGFYSTGGSGGGRAAGDGGAAFAGTTNQGYAGGTSSGSAGAGGGGAGGVGGNTSTGTGGNGGAGVTSSITGVAVARAGGGAGGGATAGGTATAGGGTGGQNTVINTAGTANTGGGAGSCYGVNPSPANGGSGVVILAYPNYFRALTVSSGLTYTLSTTSRAGFYVYTFTAGVGLVSF